MSGATMPSPAVGGQPGQPGQPREEAAIGRRRTELSMIAFAFGLTAFAFISTAMSLKGQRPVSIVEYMIAFMAIIIGAHLAVRRWAPYTDPLILPLATVLSGLGIVMTYRLTQAGRNGNPGCSLCGSGTLSVPMSSSATIIQIVYTAIGVALFVAFLVFVPEPRVLQRYTYLLGLLGLVAIALPAFLPNSISEVANTGAKIQIRLSGGFTVQPEEFAKLALAASFAGYLVVKRDVLALAGRRVLGIDLPRGRDLGPIALVWVVSLLLLVFESDIGTSAVFMGLFVAMIYIATSRTSWLLIGFVSFVIGAFAASALFAHVHERFDIWLHPFNGGNPQGNAYQLIQGLYGMANGGLLGKGLGNGQPFWTPLVQSDFIFTAFGEEIGLAGIMALLLIYGLLVERGLRTAIMVKDSYAKLLAGGLSFMLALQVFVIVGGVTRLIPLTGITTPFLSQGGSSLVASWILIAVLARLSDTARRPPPRPIQDEGLTQVVSLK